VLYALAAGAAAACIVLAVVLARAARDRSRLREALEQSLQELEQLQTGFARFAPRQVVERVIAGDANAAEHRHVTVLFADLVGFTKLSEQLEPSELVRILNGYFRAMSGIVAEHRGHVAKFIGDGMMVLFGALEANPWQANDAVHAALAMQAGLKRYSEEIANTGAGPLRAGIGIHQGPAIAGVIGSHELVEFTVIGATVNLASRLEHHTRACGESVVLSEQVARSLDPRFRLRDLGTAALPGIAAPVRIFGVDRFDG
jgi:adenylate cyclase